MRSATAVAERQSPSSAVTTDGLTTDGLTRRRCSERIMGGPNAHLYWYQARNHIDGWIFGPLRIVLNYVVIYLCKHLPSLTLKRWILRRLGIRIGKNVTIASGVTLDYFFPELITIGPNTIVGMNAMLLTHEFLHDRLRTGEVKIGAYCLLAANCTVLAGTSIGDGATVSAMSLVHKCVPPGAFVGGVPISILRN
jgi:acetyltransferase-like isoleucine patch superfamily enzyme